MVATTTTTTTTTGGGQMAPQGGKVARTKSGRPMKLIYSNPYPGADGCSCDQCNRDIQCHQGFWHSYEEESDYCQRCARMYMR